MKPAQLVLTLLFVAGGILIYDVVVRDRRDPIPVSDMWLERDVEDPEDLEGADLRLEGLGDELWREEMERRLEALEIRRASRGRRAVADAGGGPGSLAGEALEESSLDGSLEAEPASPAEGALGSESEEGTRQPLDRAELAVFRRKLEAVERQRRLQRTVRSINGAINRLGLSLTDDQRREVVKSTLAFQNDLRSLRRMPGRDAAAREDRKAAHQTLRADYTRSLEGLMPVEDAQKFTAGVMRASTGSRSEGERRNRERAKRKRGERR